MIIPEKPLVDHHLVKRSLENSVYKSIHAVHSYSPVYIFIKRINKFIKTKIAYKEIE